MYHQWNTPFTTNQKINNGTPITVLTPLHSQIVSLCILIYLRHTIVRCIIVYTRNQSDVSDSNGSLNSSDCEGELCGIGAVCTLRNEYRGKMIIEHLNINSLAEKFVHIEDVLLKEPIELLCIIETKLNESYLQDFSISQYRTYHRDRLPHLRGKCVLPGLEAVYHPAIELTLHLTILKHCV